MSKFKVGDLVALTGQSEVMRVLEYGIGFEAEPDTVHVALGNDDSSDWFRADELTLVSKEVDAVFVQDKPKAKQDKRTNDELHQDVCKLLAQAAEYMTDRLDGDRVVLKVSMESTGVGESKVEFTACIRYEHDVISDDLFKSARVACDRYLEDQTLAPRQITYNGEAA